MFQTGANSNTLWSRKIWAKKINISVSSARETVSEGFLSVQGSCELVNSKITNEKKF